MLEPGSDYKANKNEYQIGELMSQDPYNITIDNNIKGLRRLSNYILLDILPGSALSSYYSTWPVYNLMQIC